MIINDRKMVVIQNTVMKGMNEYEQEMVYAFNGFDSGSFFNDRLWR